MHENYERMLLFLLSSFLSSLTMHVYLFILLCLHGSCCPLVHYYDLYFFHTNINKIDKQLLSFLQRTTPF